MISRPFSKVHPDPCFVVAGFAALASGGALWQDRKLIGRYGDSYVSYVRATSVLPFVALLQRRQSFAADDRIGRRLLVSAAIALLLLATHRWWSAFNGATFAGLMAVGGACVSARRWWHSRARPSAAPLFLKKKGEKV